MTAFLTAIGLMMVIEGALYALFPGGMKRMMEQALAMSEGALRAVGLAIALAGFGLVWLLQG
ncbi:MAG: DUF2065 domain-containing protein [Alphaproteobacteria bacterium]|nr:DUF2065 domain-containing protein [Alphaproteobacteria bacterium]